MANARPDVHAPIRDRAGLEGIEPVHLQGFFDGWPDPPTSETHLRILRGSSFVVLAVDADTGRIVGFVTALSDVLLGLGDLYMVDVACDADVVSFYQRLGFRPTTGAGLRCYARQTGVPEGRRLGGASGRPRPAGRVGTRLR